MELVLLVDAGLTAAEALARFGQSSRGTQQAPLTVKSSRFRQELG
jgi:hypothetical protein